MLTGILITIAIVAALGHALAGGRYDPRIIRRPYNNRYNAASAAREDSLS